jgi:DNA polymerase I-like protein with 3'-5' exonuclease and polymerase domains
MKAMKNMSEEHEEKVIQKKGSKKQYTLLKNADSLDRMLDYVRDLEYVAFDIETNGLGEHKVSTIGVAVSGHFDTGYYAAFYDWNPVTKSLVRLIPEDVERAFIKRLCKILTGKKLIMHNAVFDVTVFRHQYDENLTESVHCDTMLLKHTIDEERPFGLKDLAILYKEEIGIAAEDMANQEQLELAESVKRNGGKWTQQDKEIWKGEVDLVGYYACADVDLTLRMFDFFEDQLYKQRLDEFFYEQEVMPLFREATTQMKYNGVYVDVAYFEGLKREIQDESARLEREIFTDIEEDIQEFVRKHVAKEVDITKTGRFAVELLAHYGLTPPVNSKTGKATVAKSALKALCEEYPNHPALNWLTYEPIMACPYELDAEGKVVKTKAVRVYTIDPDEPELDEEAVFEIKKKIYLDNNPDHPHIFNLGSNAHLGWLIFDQYGCEPEELSRKTQKPKLDADNLEKYEHLPFIKKLLEMKKLDKMLSTYINPILEMQTDGWIYPSMQQYGTTSGRYSCGGGLNLQTLPRDDKRIKKGFIAPPGYKIVNADFSALEPRIFSWVSGDEGLKDIWRKGLDLYSQIAIDVFGLANVSANEKDPNYLKKVMPDYRQKTKVFTLAVPYGANAWRVAQLMGVEVDEAQEIIDAYLDSYPELKVYMADCERAAQRTGMVRTKFGRIRHLQGAKELHRKYGTRITDKRAMKARCGDDVGQELYYKYRNYMNNSKNFPIQSTAASVCNAALIKLSKLFKKNKIDGWICLQVHDEITCIVREDQAEFAAELLKDSMENNVVTAKIDIPILAEPMVADNLAEAK